MKTTQPPLWRELATTIEDAVSPVLNRRLGSGLPPLRWAVRHAEGSDVSWSGQASAGDYDEAEARRAVEQWAAAFGFETQERHGTVEFQGWVGDLFILVWGVVDRALFEKGLA